MLGVAKIHVWIKGLTGEDLGVSEIKIKCESEILGLAWRPGRQDSMKLNVRFDLGVVGHVVAVDGELDGVAHQEEHHDGH